MSSRTWWKSSSRDFMPSRYTEIGKAMVRVESAGPPGLLPGGRRTAHGDTGGLLNQEEADLQTPVAGIKWPLGSTAGGTGSET